MFIGHFAPAFAARAISDKAPKLGVLFVAAQLVDWAFFLFVLLGVEQMRIVPGITAMNPLDFFDYPITHSLLGTAGWAIGFAVLVFALSRNAIGAVLAGGVVLSHWLLDWISHRPDLTLTGAGEHYGLGLWNYPAAAISIELAITIGAFALYLKRTKGPIVPACLLMAVLLIAQAVNWFGPAPTTVDGEFITTGLAAFAVITLIAAWVGSSRWHKREVGLAVASPPR